jgi:hypothetical protein
MIFKGLNFLAIDTNTLLENGLGSGLNPEIQNTSLGSKPHILEKPYVYMWLKL